MIAGRADLRSEPRPPRRPRRAGVIFVVLGVFQSFVVRIPEGAQALALRRGRFERTLPAGVHILPPWIAVTHVVTKREIPFAAPGHQVPTADGVRVDIDLLITFSIEAADRFVFRDLGARLRPGLPGRQPGCPATARPRHAVRDGSRHGRRRVETGAASPSASTSGYGVVVLKVVLIAVRRQTRTWRPSSSAWRSSSRRSRPKRTR